MIDSKITYNFIEKQEILSVDEQFVCPMCEGSHGFNSNCQRND